jgi:hypothetical protein
VIERYGEHPSQVLELFEPEGQARGAAVLIHGGFWRAAYDRTHTGPLTSALASAGYVAATPEFRRTGEEGGGWPGTFDDVAAALVTDGYERHGDVLESDSSFVEGSYGVIADAGDGVLVLGYNRQAVAEAIEDAPSNDNPARPLIERVEGVVRSSARPTDLGCIEGIAAGESADLRRGEIRIEVEGEAAPGRLNLPDALALPEFEFGKPEVKGNVVTAEVAVDPQSGRLSGPIDLLATELAPSEIYAC